MRDMWVILPSRNVANINLSSIMSAALRVYVSELLHYFAFALKNHLEQLLEEAAASWSLS